MNKKKLKLRAIVIILVFIGVILIAGFIFIYLNGGIQESPQDTLDGKHWYVIGDSATSGVSSENPIATGKYAGKRQIYPYFIGNRANMTIHNLARSGAVIATIPDQQNRYQYSKEGIYNTIVGDDADYITIWLGANDMWENVPIGSIESTDATTFYGAWNKLIIYYKENFPNAKLGIIVSFWLTTPYAEAVKNVATIHNVPILNFYDDTSLPVTIGSQRPDVSAEVKKEVDDMWRVSPTDGHPSAAYQEYESYYIEAWLKSL